MSPKFKFSGRVYYCLFHLVCPGIKFGERNFFLGLVQIEIHLFALLSFCTKPRKSFSRQIFSRDGGGTNQVETTIPVLQTLKAESQPAQDLQDCGLCKARRSSRPSKVQQNMTRAQRREEGSEAAAGLSRRRERSSRMSATSETQEHRDSIAEVLHRVIQVAAHSQRWVARTLCQFLSLYG